MKPREVDPSLVSGVVFSIERCLARHDATLSAPTSNDLEALARYWAAAARFIGEDLALRIATEIPIGALGLASYGLISAPTVGDALRTLGDSLDRLVPELSLRVLAVERGQVEVRVHGEGHPMMPLLEEIVLARLRVHAPVLVSTPTVHAVGLRRPAPETTTPWRTFFGVLPRFGQRHSVLRLSASDLQIAVRTASPAHQAIVRAAIERPDDPSMAARVRAYVRAHVREALDPTAVARELGVTSRTLQRRLREEHTSIRELTTEVRITVAREMLEHTETTIAEIAAAVGFSQSTSFCRAFVTATSETPQAYRKRHQD